MRPAGEPWGGHIRFLGAAQGKSASCGRAQRIQPRPVSLYIPLWTPNPPKFTRHREFPASLWGDVERALSANLEAIEKKLAENVKGASKTTTKKKKKIENLMADWTASAPKVAAEG